MSGSSRRSPICGNSSCECIEKKRYILFETNSKNSRIKDIKIPLIEYKSKNCCECQNRKKENWCKEVRQCLPKNILTKDDLPKDILTKEDLPKDMMTKDDFSKELESYIESNWKHEEEDNIIEWRPIFPEFEGVRKYLINNFIFDEGTKFGGLVWDTEKKLFVVKKNSFYLIQIDTDGSLSFCLDSRYERIFAKTFIQGSSLHNINFLTVGDTLSVIPIYDYEVKLWSHNHKINQNFGKSCHITGDGLRVLIGSEDKIHYGEAYVFAQTETIWSQESVMVSEDREQGDGFGNAVAIDTYGQYAIIGADQKDSYTGAAYIFKRVGVNWVQQQKLGGSIMKEFNQFGISVDISDRGDYSIVGAPFDILNNKKNVGTVNIFKRELNAWIEQIRIEHSDIKEDFFFGTSVCISGDGSMAVIGATGADGVTSNTGAVYVMKRDGEKWVEHSKLVAEDGKSDDAFGMSISISKNGEYIVVGAPGINALQTLGFTSKMNGYVYVYKYDETENVWKNIQKIEELDGKPNQAFGLSVGISGNSKTLVIGSQRKNGSTGSIYLYRRVNGEYIEEKEIVASDRDTESLFGNSVGLSDNGTRITVGSKGDNDFGIDSGSAYMYNIIGYASMKILRIVR